MAYIDSQKAKNASKVNNITLWVKLILELLVANEKYQQDC